MFLFQLLVRLNNNFPGFVTFRLLSIRSIATCLIYARALLEYVIVIIIMWLRSVIKMIRSVKFPEDKVLTFLILRGKC